MSHVDTVNTRDQSTYCFNDLNCEYILAHNCLNIQQIFNPKKSFRMLRIRVFHLYWECPPIPSNPIYVDTVNASHKISNAFNPKMYWQCQYCQYRWKALILSFPKLFMDWKSIEYQGSYEPFEMYWQCWHCRYKESKGLKHSMLCMSTLLTQKIKACNALNAMYVDTIDTGSNYIVYHSTNYNLFWIKALY